MHEVFQNWPKVETAYKLIRATRSEQYFSDWDRFSKKWAEVLGVPVHIAMLSGPNLGAVIDTLFETAPQGEHEALKASILEATDIDKARSILDHPPAILVEAMRSESALRAAAKDRSALEAALRNHIACVTEEGRERLGFKTRLANRWGRNWVKAIRLHAEHQIAHEEAARTADRRPERTMTPEDAIEAYIESFAHTDTFSTMLVAVFPFLPFTSKKSLRYFVKQGQSLAGIMRLIGDVVFNPEEIINTTLFARSRSEGISLTEAKQTPARDPLKLRKSVVDYAEKRLNKVESDLARDLELVVARKYVGRAQCAHLNKSFGLLMTASRHQIKLGRDALSS